MPSGSARRAAPVPEKRARARDGRSLRAGRRRQAFLDPRRLARPAGKARRQAGRVARARGRRRQPQSRLHRRGAGRRARGQAGAALCAPRRRILAAAARAVVVRIQRARRGGPLRSPPDAASLPFRSRAGDDRDGIPFAAYHHAQRFGPRDRVPALRRRHRRVSRCDAVPHLGGSPAPRPSTSAGSSCSRAISSSAGSPRTWSSPIPTARRRSTAGPARNSTPTSAPSRPTRRSRPRRRCANTSS